MEKVFMKAPTGVTFANAEGQDYEVPKSGIIEVKSANHLDTLKRHGFVECDQEDEGLTEDKIDEIDDKEELVRIIEERGGEADDSMKLAKLRRLAKAAISDEDD